MSDTPELPPRARRDADRRLWRLWREGRRPELRRFLDEVGPLSPDQLTAVLAVDQRERWLAGDRVPAEEYLRDHPGLAAEAERALELVYGEYLLLEELGEAPAAEDYVRRFPQFADRLEQQFRFHRALASGPARSDTSTPPTRSQESRGPHGPSAPLPDVAGYEVLGELGRGGMGVVYKARQAGLNRVVALKMIRAEEADPAELARFRAEAEAAARVRHPNVVQVFEVGEHRGRPYFSMEYADGGSLRRQLDGLPLPPREAAALAEDLARAVQAAHEQGVVHRDLKPANVLLTSAGLAGPQEPVPGTGERPRLAGLTPKVADFGLAKRLDEEAGHTQTGALVGTPSYMAPEQAAGRRHDVGPHTDVWALGAVLYECLTGWPPFRAPEVVDTLLQVLNDEPAAPSRLQPGLPRDLETVCLKCLHKDPRRRYASAAELAGDLRRFLDGRPVKARPLTALGRGWRWCRRNPVVAGLTGAVAAALLLGAATATGLALHAGAQAELARASEGAALGKERLAMQETQRANLALAREAEEKDLKVRQLMTAQLLRVAAACERDPGLARGLLYDTDLCPPRLRDASWGYYERRCARWEVATLYGHPGWVLAVAYSPDGRTVATGSGTPAGLPGGADPGEVRLWDATTGQLRATLAGNVGPVWSVAFSPDGGTLATGSEDGARLWDVKSGKLKAALRGHEGGVAAVAFSPDGKTLAGGDGAPEAPGAVRLWDLETGHLVAALEGHEKLVTAVAYGPDGRTLASGSADQTVRLWDAGTGKLRATLRGHREPGGLFSLPGDHFLSVAYSPDGLTLASGGGDGTVRLWDARTGQPRAVFEGASLQVRSVAFSPDGRTLASASDDQVRLWDARTGGHRVTLRAHAGSVTSVAFGPDGLALASGSWDQTARLWDLKAELPEAASLAHEFGVGCVAFGRDGLSLASVCAAGFGLPNPDAVRLWDVPSGRSTAVLRGHGLGVTGAAYSPDQLTLATGSFDRTVRLWDAKTGRPLSTLAGHSAAVLALAYSPDGLTLASASQDRTVRLWDVGTGEARTTLKEGPFTLHCVAFSPDGATLAVAGDRAVRLWDVKTGERKATLEGHADKVHSVAFSPDGLALATASSDRTVRLWDAKTGRTTATLRGHTDAVWTVAFSPDGRSLASGSSDRSVHLWDVKTGQGRAAIRGHTDAVRSVVFSADGRTLASGSLDGTVRLWDVRTDRAWTPLRFDEGDAWSVAFSPDGRIVFGRGRGGGQAWTVADGRPAEADEPEGVVLGAVAGSPDGSLRAEARGDVVALFDTARVERDRSERLALDPLSRASWLRRQAKQAEQDGDRFAAAFRLTQMVESAPGDADLLRRRDQARRHLQPPVPMPPPPRP